MCIIPAVQSLISFRSTQLALPWENVLLNCYLPSQALQTPTADELVPEIRHLIFQPHYEIGYNTNKGPKGQGHQVRNFQGVRIGEQKVMIFKAGEPSSGGSALSSCLSRKREKTHPQVYAFSSQNSPYIFFKMYAQYFHYSIVCNSKNLGEKTKCASVGNVNKSWHSHLMKYYAVVKKEISLYVLA